MVTGPSHLVTLSSLTWSAHVCLAAHKSSLKLADGTAFDTPLPDTFRSFWAVSTQRGINIPGSWCPGRGGVKKLWNQTGEIRKRGESLQVVTSGLPSPGLPEESPREVPKEQGQKRQGKQPRAPARVLHSVFATHRHTGSLCHHFQAPRPFWAPAGLPQAPRSREWERDEWNRDGPVSPTTIPFCCLKMSSAKHVLSPHSPRPPGREVAAGVRAGKPKLKKGAHLQPRILEQKKENRRASR